MDHAVPQLVLLGAVVVVIVW